MLRISGLDKWTCGNFVKGNPEVRRQVGFEGRVQNAGNEMKEETEFRQAGGQVGKTIMDGEKPLKLCIYAYNSIHNFNLHVMV